MIEVVRATEEYQRAGAYYVRIQAMARAYGISLREEFDAHDGPGCRYIVLLEDGFPVATCRWFPIESSAEQKTQKTGEFRDAILPEGSVEIGRVVVLPEYRGQRLGERAVLEAEKWIAEEGFTRIAVSARKGVEGFYEKLGYTYNDRYSAHNYTFACTYMEKHLTQAGTS